MAKKDDQQKEPVKEELALIGEIPAVKLKAPKGATSVNVEGEEYPVEEGFVVVPTTAREVLLDHGYTDAE